MVSRSFRSGDRNLDNLNIHLAKNLRLVTQSCSSGSSKLKNEKLRFNRC